MVLYQQKKKEKMDLDTIQFLYLMGTAKPLGKWSPNLKCLLTTDIRHISKLKKILTKIPQEIFFQKPYKF